MKTYSVHYRINGDKLRIKVDAETTLEAQAKARKLLPKHTNIKVGDAFPVKR